MLSLGESTSCIASD